MFLQSYWLNVLKKTYNFSIVLVKQADNKNTKIVLKDFNDNNFEPYGIYLPLVIKNNKNHKKLVSLPFTDYIDIENEEFLNSSINLLLDKFPSSKIELRTKINDDRFEKKLVGYLHKLDLNESEENIFKRFKVTQVQQCIRKSIKNGLVSKVTNDFNSLEDFYNLHLMTRKKLGVPIQPKKFFLNLWYEIIKKNYGFVILVYKDFDLLSSGIFIGKGEKIIYKFSASNTKFLHFRPNNLMLWTAIQEAKRRGYSVFDFGRTEIENEGLRKFKLGWGTIEEPLYYSYYPKAPDDSKFKWIKDKIVAPIIRNSPKFVCRLSGELFYKYFG